MALRIAFVGAGELTSHTAALFVALGHKVIIVDTDQGRIDELTAHLDCSFLHGDGSSPAVLGEIDPQRTDLLLALTDNDQTNIIASLVGRSLGFKRVITRIHDPQFEPICRELGLEDTISPSRTIARYLVDMATGGDFVELSSFIKDEARLYSFVADDADAGPAQGLDLPDRTRAICYYRDGDFGFVDPDTRVESGDEVVVLAHREAMAALKGRWGSRGQQAEEAANGAPPEPEGEG